MESVFLLGTKAHVKHLKHTFYGDMLCMGGE